MWTLMSKFLTVIAITTMVVFGIFITPQRSYGVVDTLYEARLGSGTIHVSQTETGYGLAATGECIKTIDNSYSRDFVGYFSSSVGYNEQFHFPLRLQSGKWLANSFTLPIAGGGSVGSATRTLSEGGILTEITDYTYCCSLEGVSTRYASIKTLDLNTGEYNVHGTTTESYGSCSKYIISYDGSGTLPIDMVPVSVPTPVIDSISPVAGTIGSTMTITGAGFGSSSIFSNVKFGNTPAQTFLWWSDTSIIVQVPDIPGGDYSVVVSTLNGQSNLRYFHVVGCDEFIAKQVHADVYRKPTSAGEGMVGNFHFRTPLSASKHGISMSLADAERACKVAHFNWYQEIVSITVPDLVISTEGASTLFPGIPLSDIRLSLEKANAYLLGRGTGVDPALDGNPANRVLCFNANTSDSLPFYWDERFPDPTACPWYSGGKYLIGNHTNGNGLDVLDIPNMVIAGTKIAFRTCLAGVMPDGAMVLWSPSWETCFGWMYTEGTFTENGIFSCLPDSTKTCTTVQNIDPELGGTGKVTIFSVNQPPIADAGSDQVVNEGDPVTLNGSGSIDPQGLPLQFNWSQVSGPPVTLNLSDPIHPTFVSPNVSASGATLSFQLIVSDGQLTSTSATVNVTVKNVNHPPVALVGLDQAVAEASLVTLDASASYDPDAEPLTYVWQQLSGPTVTLSDPTQPKPTFLAPLVGSTGMTLSFKLTVSDGQASAETTTNVNVTNVNHQPVANAGPDQTRNAETTVQLDGTASTDPDNDPLTFTWSQLSGPTVTLSNVHSATPTFVGPHVAIATTLTFQLLVEDGFGGTASTDVHVTLLPVDAPPVCTHAKAHPQRLWPPDHKLADIKIVGVTDPDSRKVAVTVTHVTQDEPVGCIARRGYRDYWEDDDETRGCRHTTPDAVIHRDGHVALRAERREHDNGRVYHVTFQADDGAGGQCTGQVTVCVPHDRHHTTCMDDGQRYEATQR
jgi:hypothetical protein